jgi:hypothetical protein
VSESRHFLALDANTHPSQPLAQALGSAVWDILEPIQENNQGYDFEDHIQACGQLIERIRRHYPNVTIYWKSPEALHVHTLLSKSYKDKKCIKRTKYPLSHFLHSRQKQLMKDLGVPFIDL